MRNKLSKDLLIKDLRKDNWTLNNKLRAAERRIIELTYLSQTVERRKSGQLPTELECKALRHLNQELIKRIQKVGDFAVLNGKEDEKQATEAREEGDQVSDGLCMERGESEPKE
jgi:hypothetical protein